MALSIGIIGLPNAGKSTVFNVLVQAPAALTASYPFSTVDPNRALIEVPDDRLAVLGDLVGHERQVRVRMEIIDIAGLVAGAAQGEGLGNRFLDQIRRCNALLHVVGFFGPEAGTDRAPDALRTAVDTIHQELMLSDLMRLENKIARLHREIKGDAKRREVLETAEQVQSELEHGTLIRQGAARRTPGFGALEQEMSFTTAKPELLLVNMDELLLADAERLEAGIAPMQQAGHQAAAMCALMEADMVELLPHEQAEYREAFNVPVAGLIQVVHECFGLLRLIRFYTLGDHEVRAWEIPRGSRAVDGAGCIHTDFVRGFIAAEVIPYPVLVEAGSEKQARNTGLIRIEGRDYTIQDGDVIRFRFNV